MSHRCIAKDAAGLTYRWRSARQGRMDKFVGASKIMADITDRKRADQAEREGQERMTAVMENLTEGIMVAEAGGLVVYWNAAALAIFGYASIKECRRKLADSPTRLNFGTSTTTACCRSRTGRSAA